MTVGEFEKLIRTIELRTGLQAGEIAIGLGYNEGYISQIKSRNNIPGKFVNALRNKYLKEDEEDISSVNGVNESPSQYGNISAHMKIIESQQRTIEHQAETIRMLVSGNQGGAPVRKRAS